MRNISQNTVSLILLHKTVAVQLILSPHIFSVEGKTGACLLQVSGDEFRIKQATGCDVQQPRNEIPAERTKRKKRQLKKFQVTQLQESVENLFELRSPSQRTTGQEINIFYGNFLHLLSFLQQNFLLLFHQ